MLHSFVGSDAPVGVELEEGFQQIYGCLVHLSGGLRSATFEEVSALQCEHGTLGCRYVIHALYA